MRTPTTQRIEHALALGLALCGTLLTLGGCSTRSHPNFSSYDAVVYPIRTPGSGSTSALVFSPGLERSNANPYLGAYAAEFGRNDHTLSLQDRSRRDELFGIPPERRATLEYQRTFRSSRNADEYRFPSGSGRRYGGYRGYGHYRRD